MHHSRLCDGVLGMMSQPDAPGSAANLGAPSGWQMPPERRWFVPSLTMLGVAFLVGIVLAYGSTRLIAAAWTECGDYEPPYGFGLLFFDLPLLTVLAGSGFAVGALTVGRWSRPAEVIAGLSVAALIAVAYVAQLVPMGPATDYAIGPQSRAPYTRATAACGPQGIPTWWPWWLPS